MAAAFFYGTLLHPEILKRVIGHDGSYLQIRPALLLDYTRHKINVDEQYIVVVQLYHSHSMNCRVQIIRV
ncbi:hypothetical protein L210DRAFT_3536793 [Boletus edulis BED1]|uniref:Uncharacterized protein n=1 Tax=Boletus edulis BED1 TaxID=1328754 RepID=A0AAD4BXI1_BOLED|nr:hypothetical protein L210DRAFT_3536793 [Boletus edulis BED1]